MSVRITDKGSIPQCVWVSVQGVLAYGLINSGADITILGGDLFKRVATVGKLKKNFRPTDKVPFTYDQCSFQLDGRMDMEIGLGKCDDNTCIHKNGCSQSVTPLERYLSAVGDREVSSEC